MKKGTGTPLQSIIAWWEGLRENHQYLIAGETCLSLRLLQEFTDDPKQRFREFLSSEVTLGFGPESYVGRVIALRSLIDFVLINLNPERAISASLEGVETVTDLAFKSVLNKSIAHAERDRPDWEKALVAWDELKAGELSDAALQQFHRDSIARFKRKKS